MNLNDLSPAPGSKKTRKRVGRGIGSGLGKTCGRGHKGQHSRSGGYHKVGFEGGQMPLQRRVPKRGFRSMSAGMTVEITLGEIEKAAVNNTVDLEILKTRRMIRGTPMKVKVIATGTIKSSITVTGLAYTAGAKAAIEAAGGKAE